jgi:hypothetical protein
MRKIILFFSIIAVVIACSVSCKKATFNPGTTIASKAANGWWCTMTSNGADIYGIGTFFFSTYNTAANDDSLWLDDHGHAWQVKFKVLINYKTLTFAVTNGQNQYYNSTISVTNGKVLPGAGHSKSGVVTDSLYMQVTFSDDPYSLQYVIAGTARTGLIQDDY